MASSFGGIPLLLSGSLTCPSDSELGCRNGSMLTHLPGKITLAMQEPDHILGIDHLFPCKKGYRNIYGIFESLNYVSRRTMEASYLSIGIR